MSLPWQAGAPLPLTAATSLRRVVAPARAAVAALVRALRAAAGKLGKLRRAPARLQPQAAAATSLRYVVMCPRPVRVPRPKAVHAARQTRSSVTRPVVRRAWASSPRPAQT